MNANRYFLCIALAALAVALAGNASSAPVAIAGPGTYTQNFDALFSPAAAGSVMTVGNMNWADDSTIPGWWYHYTGQGAGPGTFAGWSFSYSGNDGSIVPILWLNSAGAAGSTDRAFCTPSTNSRVEQSGIVIFQNTGTKSISLTQIHYSGEVYRTNSTARVIESVVPHFRRSNSLTEALTLSGNALTSAEASRLYPATIATSPIIGNYLTGWTRIPSAIWSYSSPDAATQKTGTGVDSYRIHAVDLTDIRMEPGQFLAVRFSNPNDSGTDALMGIDDLSITFSDPPPYLLSRVSGVVRSDSGTSSDPTDDTVSFDLTVTGNTGSWTAHGPLSQYGPDTGGFDVPVSYTGVPISAFSSAPPYALLTKFSVSQILTGYPVSVIQEDFTLDAPAPTITVAADAFARDALDNFTANLFVTGQFTADTWNLSGLPGQPGDPLPVHHYDTEVALPPLPANGPQGPFVARDSITTAVINTFYLLPPYIIGQATFGGVTTDIISNGALTATPVTWMPDPGSRTLTMSDGDANGAGTSAKEITADVNLAGVSGPVRFSMQLMVSDVGSGFEAADTFTAFLVYNDGTADLAPVSLISPDMETVALNGILTGKELVPGPNVDQLLNFSAIIPDHIVSVKLVIRGIVDSPSETMQVRNVLLEEAGPILTAAVEGAVLDHKGTVDPLDDRLSLAVNLSAYGQGDSLGWTADLPAGDTPLAGLYSSANPVVFSLGLPAAPSTSRVFNITDNLNPAMAASVAASRPASTLTASLVGGSIVRDEKGTLDPADDTVSFQVNISSAHAGPEYTATVALHPGIVTGAGVYPAAGGPVTLTLENIPSAAATLTVVIADASYPTLPAPVAIAVAVPAPTAAGDHILGRKVLNGVTSDVLAASPVPLWVNYPQGRQSVMTSGVRGDAVIESEIVDLTNIGTTTVHAVLRARDSSTGSNFESTDRFKIELVIDGDTANAVNLVTRSMDLGAGNDATVDPGRNGAPNGYLNGYNGAGAFDFLDPSLNYATTAANYNANRLRDEFNPTGLAVAAALDTLISFAGTVPASAVSVQLRIYGQGIAGSESFTVQDVILTGDTEDSALDSDGDGMTDVYEVANGLVNGTNDAALDRDGDGQPNIAEFFAGTVAGNAADVLRVIGITRSTVPGVYDVVLATVPGKRYQLQSSTDLGATDHWTAASPVADAAAFPATSTTLQATLSGNRVFLRGVVIP